MTTTIARYETTVPDAFCNPVRDLVRQWARSVLGALELSDDVYSTDLDEIENEARSGFIPYTDGGFDGTACASLSYAYGSGLIPKSIRPYIDRDLRDCREQWDSDNPDHPYDSLWGDDRQPDLFGGSEEADHWREKYYEFEDEYLHEGGTYFYKLRAMFYSSNNSRNETGEPEVYFCVGLNTDFEYGRDYIDWAGGKQTEWCFEKTVSAAKITNELIEQLSKEAIESLNSL